MTRNLKDHCTEPLSRASSFVHLLYGSQDPHLPLICHVPFPRRYTCSAQHNTAYGSALSTLQHSITQRSTNTGGEGNASQQAGSGELAEGSGPASRGQGSKGAGRGVTELSGRVTSAGKGSSWSGQQARGWGLGWNHIHGQRETSISHVLSYPPPPSCNLVTSSR